MAEQMQHREQLDSARAEADGLRSRVRTLEDERDILDEGLVVLELAIHYGDWTAVKAYYRAANKLLSGDDTGEEMQQRIQRVREHIAESTRAEAARYRQQYEALRTGVERVVQDLHKRARATARDWQRSRHPYHDGASDAYYEAGLMVRRVLTEAGGGDRG